MKNKLILIAVFLLGVVGFAKADGFFTTRSSGVFVTSNTSAENITSIKVSTGNGIDYFVLIDSNPCPTLLCASASFPDIAAFPVSQWIMPPIVVRSTSALGVGYGADGTVPIPTGGIQPKKGLLIWGSAAINAISIYSSPK